MKQDARWQTHLRYPYLLAKYGSVALLFLFVFALLYRLRIVTIPILFAAILAFLLTPSVDLLCRHRINRTVASAVMVVFALLIMSLLVLLVVPTIAGQLSDIVLQIPWFVDQIEIHWMPWIRDQLGLALTLDKESIQQFAQAHFRELASPSGWLLGKVFSSALSLVMALLNLLIVIVFTFYLLRSWHNILEKTQTLIPARFRKGVNLSMTAVNEALSAFVRGQLIVCFILGTVYSVALSLIGVKSGMVIGIIAGILGFIPYLGLITGLVLSLLSIALAYAGPGQVIATVILFIAVPALDTAFLTPNVVGEKTGLNPFFVIVALLIGGELLGFLGLLLALPTAAILRALIRVWFQSYSSSKFYLGTTQTENPPEST